jgi:hypothetical protein
VYRRLLLLIDRRLVDQHDGDLIANRIKPMAGDTSEALAIGLEFDFRPAGGTNQDFEELSADSHWFKNRLVYQVCYALACTLGRLSVGLGKSEAARSHAAAQTIFPTIDFEAIRL